MRLVSLAVKCHRAPSVYFLLGPVPEHPLVGRETKTRWPAVRTCVHTSRDHTRLGAGQGSRQALYLNSISCGQESVA